MTGFIHSMSLKVISSSLIFHKSSYFIDIIFSLNICQNLPVKWSGPGDSFVVYLILSEHKVESDFFFNQM